MAENYRPSDKKKINRHADHDHWPASIKSTCQWFPFHAIMEYTENIMQDDTHLMSSLLKMFLMFEICLSCGDNYLDVVSLNCIDCKKETGLNSETHFTWVYDQVITKLVLNAMLHHVGISWIISSNHKMDYDKYANSNHLDWFNKVPWYNKNICSKLH